MKRIFRFLIRKVKIKVQLKVLKHVKALYEKRLSRAKEKRDLFKNRKNESTRKIEEENIEYFTGIILTLSCIIEDIQYELIVQ